MSQRGHLRLGICSGCQHGSSIPFTGAVRTVLPQDVVTRLGLGIRRQRVVEYADGRKERVSVTEPFVVELAGRDTLETTAP